MTAIKRRIFLAGSFTAGLITAWGIKTHWLNTHAVNRTFFLSANDDNQGNHFISGWSLSGQQRFLIPVSQRAHDCCYSPDKSLGVFFARRPGTQIYIVDLINNKLRHIVKAKHGYHFYGHGVFSHDGQYLFTTENNYQASNPNKSGIIAVYNSNSFKRITEFQSGGIGPHQLAFLNDGHTLAIANGGILTHPSKQRTKLNLDSMESSLTYINSNSGEVLNQFYPADQHMSIRHLAVTTTDQVIMGIQYQGDKHQHIPLVLSHKDEKSLQAMQAEDLLWQKQNHYIASIAVDHNAHLAISTSPRGGSVCLWDLSTLQCINEFSVRDVAGAAYLINNECFLISNGLGQLMSLSTDVKPLQLQPVLLNSSICWDNHLTLIS